MDKNSLKIKYFTIDKHKCFDKSSCEYYIAQNVKQIATSSESSTDFLSKTMFSLNGPSTSSLESFNNLSPLNNKDKLALTNKDLSSKEFYKYAILYIFYYYYYLFL